MIRGISIILLIASLNTNCRGKQNTPLEGAPIKPDQEFFTRYVDGNILISNELPEIEIEVAGEFDYIGTFPFEIIANSEEYPQDLRGKPVAAGDRYVFAVSDANQVINKLFIVQLEGFLSNNDFVYNYNFDKAETIGKNKYRQNTWFYNSRQLAEENPANEGALTRAFLSNKGFELEDEFMMSRFVGLASEDRKHEIIIYYLEMLGQTTGLTLEEFENTSRKKKDSIRTALVDRSRNSFTIIKG